MDSIVDPYTPVKIKGTFFTRVPRDEATDGAQVFNWVSWTDPRSDSSTNPDVYSLGCTATIDSTSAQNAVRVTNYKGSRSFAKHDWSAQALIDLGRGNAQNPSLRPKRENPINYEAEFEATNAAIADQSGTATANGRRLQVETVSSAEMFAEFCRVDPNKYCPDASMPPNIFEICSNWGAPVMKDTWSVIARTSLATLCRADLTRIC